MPTPMLKSRDRAGAAAAAAGGGQRTSGSGIPLGDSERPGSSSGTTAQAGQEGQGTQGAEGVGSGSGGGSEDLSPPYILMEHLPLAVFTNGALTALNEFRHCTLLSLGRPAAA
jgi:hypothetical protein